LYKKKKYQDSFNCSNLSLTEINVVSKRQLKNSTSNFFSGEVIGSSQAVSPTLRLTRQILVVALNMGSISSSSANAFAGKVALL